MSIQEFYHFEPDRPEKQSDDRFDLFVKNVLPKCGTNTLIFISSYFDFVRVRNYMKKENRSFVQVHEYAKKGKVAKARNLFYTGHKGFMIMTERFYFYYRYKIKGIKSIVFYQLPMFPQFYTEIINTAMLSDSHLRSRVLYCKYDVIRLQNIFGSSIAKDLVNTEKDYHAIVGE